MERLLKFRNKFSTFILVLIGIALCYVFYVQTSEKNITYESKSYSTELSGSTANLISEIFKDNLKSLKSTAYLYGTSLKSSDVDLDLLSNLEENSCFDWIRFIGSTGIDYATNGDVTDCSDRAYFKSGMSGESGITYVKKSRINGRTLIGFYSPVYYNSEIIGILVGFTDQNTFEPLLKTKLFGFDCPTMVTTDTGDILINSSDMNISNISDIIDNDSELIKQALNNGENTYFRYKENDGYTIGHIVAIKDTDMVICQLIPAKAINKSLNKVNRNGLILLMFSLMLYVLYIIKEFSAMYRKNKELAFKAERDGLTGLYNVPAINLKLNELMALYKNSPRIMIAFIDIDNFREFNNKYGHAAGDQVIKFVADTIKITFGDGAGRNGGDEFLAWSELFTEKEDIATILEKFLKVLNEGIKLDGYDDSIPIPCSIGVCISEKKNVSKNDIVKKADAAMYVSKENGKNQYTIVENTVN